MRPIGFHVSTYLLDRRVLAPSDAARRALAASVLRVAGPHGLLAFRGSNGHLHLLLLLDEPMAREIVRRVKIGLQRVLDPGVGFAPAWFEAVRTQQHLDNAFDYVLRQDKHHDFLCDPCHDASCLLDLVGLRVVDRLLPRRLREHLPRRRPEQLVQHLGIDELVPGQVPELLREGAAAALALPDLAGRCEAAFLARCAFAQLARPALGTAEVARQLGISRRSVQRLLRHRLPPALLRAVVLQAGLREQVGQLVEGAA